MRHSLLPGDNSNTHSTSSLGQHYESSNSSSQHLGVDKHLSLPGQRQSALQRLSSEPNSPWDSVEDLPEPVLPWMRSESRNSFGNMSRSSVESGSLHVVKRFVPDASMKKKQRWTFHKWWLLLANTLVSITSTFLVQCLIR